MGSNKISPGVAIVILVIAVILVIWQFVLKPKGPRVNIPSSSGASGAVNPIAGGSQPQTLPMPRGK